MLRLFMCECNLTTRSRRESASVPISVVPYLVVLSRNSLKDDAGALTLGGGATAGGPPESAKPGAASRAQALSASDA